ncbi:MAG: flagellar M-ring protein FliF [Candidatus Saganbacteria bacterium]|nr:flagellar M-ring protein FliF [Candidatus Saganbacteria bacterium]
MAEPAAVPAGGGGFDIRRILLLAGVGLVITIAVFFFMFRGCGGGGSGKSNDYTVIYSNLDLKDAANVIARLKEINIEYEIGENGTSVAVPKSKADQARLGLAEDNLPAGGVVGWEIFDESKLGATDFDRRIQLIRAISGELSRTIRRIQAIEDARVQIVMPETRLFAESVAPVTASVMLRLKPGAVLSPEKVNGIIHLVSSSVENLQTENVTVVDSTGRILTAKPLRRDQQVVSAPVEQALLPPPLPAKEVSPEAKADAKINLLEPVKQEEKKEEPKAEEKKEEKKPEKKEEAKKEPVQEVKIEPPRQLTREEKILLMVQAKRELEQDLAGKAQEILNRFYPPNSAIVKVNVDIKNGNTGTKFTKDELNIQKITAIILVDNRVDIGKDLKSATFKAVAAAIGYNRTRGDRIVMQKVPFHLATPPPEVIKGEVEKVLPPKQEKRGLLLPGLPAVWIRNMLWLAGVLLLLFTIVLIFRLFRKEKNAPQTKIMAEPHQSQSKTQPVSKEKASAIESIKKAVDGNPEKIAAMLKDWLTE